MSHSPCPASTVVDLNSRYLDQSSRQISVDETNDFVFGKLYQVPRQQMCDSIRTIKNVTPPGRTAVSPHPVEGAVTPWH